MKNPFSQKQLTFLFRFKEEGKNRLITREGNKVEFKENFNWNSKAKYAKTIAAFANREGGYIIFGVNDSPRELVGLQNSRFDDIDEEKITQYLNEVLSPEVDWVKTVIDIEGTKIGLLYSFESSVKPVMCTKNDNELKEAEIYYRYSGRSEKIKYPELRKLIDSEREKEKKSWMSHMEKISKIGVDKVALLDTEKGKIEGSGGTIFIDENIVKQLEFIKEGEFNEKKGAKTLKLIGEVKEITGSIVLPSKINYKGIHTKEIFEALLYGKLHENTAARAYLEQLPFEQSKFMPIFFFKKLSGLSNEEIIEIFKNAQTSGSHLKYGLIKRLAEDRTYSNVGPFDNDIYNKDLYFANVKEYESYIEKNNLYNHTGQTVDKRRFYATMHKAALYFLA